LNQENFLKAKLLFDEAFNLNAAQREIFLAEKCGDDNELKKEVLSLVQSIENTKDFLEEPLTVIENNEGLFPDPFLGKQIGNYLIDGEAGVGGMGIVYTGKRNDKEFEQKIAIKILKHGITSEYLLKRFQIERQTLANLHHQNIARLLDGGRTGDGLPYLVMEFIDGIPITEFCIQKKLNIEEKLKLFRQVCSAVQYAHQNLIIHRDLKPGNILVTKDGVPKLLDFGIAKLIDEELTESSEGLTRTGVWHLTPEYASPEQIKGEKITTASDVYSLGILLYQILTGAQPYKITTNSPAAISKIITEENVKRPSDRVKQNLEIKHEKDFIDPGKISNHLKGDLDNIVLKAMHKDPLRRYVSVEQFSEDIRRHLIGFPVVAQKDTAGYRLSKFIQRHKVGFVSTVGFIVFLIASLFAIIWQANIATNERDKARIEADKFERVNKFLQNMLSSVDPDEIGRDVKVYNVLGRAAKNIETELKDKPEIEAAIRRTLGNTYTNLGEYGNAKEHLERALQLDEKIYGKESENVAVNLYDLAMYFHWLGDLKSADSLYNKSLSIFRKTLKEPTKDLVLTLNGCALIKSDLGNYSGAVKQFEEALQILEKKFGKNDIDYASILNNLAITTHSLNELDKAEKYYLEAQKIFIELLGENRSEVASTYNNLAFIYLDKKDFKHAEENFVKSYELKLKLKGKDHPDVGLALSNLGSVKFKLKNYEEAKNLYNKAIAQLKITLPDVHAWLANSYYGLGKTLIEMKDYNSAEINLRHALQIRREIYPKENHLIYITEGDLGVCLFYQNKLSEAEKLLLVAYDGNKSTENTTITNSQRFAEYLLKLYVKKNDYKNIQIYKNILQNLPKN
jgi:eukaryotic-like serine/threonine-protein kinase